MTVTNHPEHPDELRRELREKEQTLLTYSSSFEYRSAIPEVRKSIEQGAKAADLPVAVYAPIFATFMREISEARITVIRQKLSRFD